MTLGQHMTALRKKKSLPQADLGQAMGTFDVITGRYEHDEAKPSIEVAVKIADTLEVSLDYMVVKTSLELDKSTFKRIKEVSKLPAEARSRVYMVIDALIRDFTAKQAYS